MRLPGLSFLLVPVVLNTLGPEWAGEFIVALSSAEELPGDGAEENWSLELLVAEVRDVMWGHERKVPIYKKDILTRKGGYIYLSPEFQNRLCSSLGSGQGYKGAQAWIHARLSSAHRAQVRCCGCPALDNTGVVDDALLE
jgi:hypothetical protein